MGIDQHQVYSLSGVGLHYSPYRPQALFALLYIPESLKGRIINNIYS